MKYLGRVVFIFCSAVLLTIPAWAQRGGFGGAASGGHFSGHFGNMSGGFSGHSVGHAFGRMFGHHNARSAAQRANEFEPPLAGAVFLHGRVVHMPGPSSPRRTMLLGPSFFAFAPTNRLDRFPRGDVFGFAGEFCGGFPGMFNRHSLRAGDFDCVGGFFFDDFLFAARFGGSARLHGNVIDPSLALASAAMTGEVGLVGDGVLEAVPGIAPAAEPSELRDHTDSDAAVAPHSLTLLQLRDGSMYGVTNYWVSGSELHYVTDYGARTSVSLERVDLGATTALNAQRGVPFSLRQSANP